MFDNKIINTGTTRVEILRQLRGGALSQLFRPLFQALFRQSGVTSVTLWGYVGVEDPSW